ncbi:hypothetical protein OG439_07595 [Amycolatopsis sp. NBC_01307]|uniref:hypothetical protein n=1 Tax=Amycolatopsis sp. NBC_01307 TaxID=2903561 RepID=UPI002E1409EC|nr:hypothetical protein OG439_07595 [Amycolatopsis sp. NBC_01307]
MTGLEIAVGFLVGWAVRKLRRVGQGVDVEVDRALDAGLNRLHDLVSGKLGADPALAKLTAEVERAGEPSSRTQQRVQLALEDAVEGDQTFATELTALVEYLQDVERQAGGVVAGGLGIAISGGVNADRGSVAIGGVTGGDVSIARPPDPQVPGGNQG